MSIDNNPQNTVDTKTASPDKVIRSDEEILGDANFLAESKAAQSDVHRYILGGDEAVKNQAGMFDRWKMAMAGTFTVGVEDRQAKKGEVNESVAMKGVEAKMKELEQAGGEIVSKKTELRSRSGKIEKELKSSQTDLDSYRKKMEENLKIFENDPNFADSVEEFKETISQEEATKEELINELKDQKANFDMDASLELDEVSAKSDFERKREVLITPAQEKMETINTSLEEFNGIYSELKEKRSSYSSQSSFYANQLRKLGTGTAETFMREKIEARKEEIDNQIKKFQESEAKLKERIDVIKAEKSKVEAYIRRIEYADQTPEEIREIAAERRKKEAAEKAKQVTQISPEQLAAQNAEKESRKKMEDDIKAAIGGEDEYDEVVSGFSDYMKKSWNKYLDLSPDDHKDAKFKLDLKNINGKNPKQINNYFKKFLNNFEKNQLVFNENEWAKILFGKNLKEMDEAERNQVLVAENRLSKNLMSGKYSESWAQDWYVEVKKEQAGNKFDEPVAVQEAKDIIAKLKTKK